VNKQKIIEDFEQKHMKQVKNSFHCDIVCSLGGKSCYVGNILKGQCICSYGKFLILNYSAFLGRKKWGCLTGVDCIRQEFFHDSSSERLCKNVNMFTNEAGIFVTAVGR